MVVVVVKPLILPPLPVMSIYFSTWLMGMEVLKGCAQKRYARLLVSVPGTAKYCWQFTLPEIVPPVIVAILPVPDALDASVSPLWVVNVPAFMKRAPVI